MDDLKTEDLEELLGEIYDEVELDFIRRNVKYTKAEVCETACKLLENTLYKMDPTSEWQVCVVYSSMQDLYEKQIIDE